MSKKKKDIFLLTELFLRGFMKNMVQSVKELDLPGAPQDMRVLMLTKKMPGVSIGEIVAETGRDKSQITRKIKDLEKRGFLRREAHAVDKRISTLYLTDEGELIAAQLEKTKKKVVSEMLGVLSDQEREDLAALLDKTLSRQDDGWGCK